MDVLFLMSKRFFNLVKFLLGVFIEQFSINGEFNGDPLPCFGAQAALDDSAVALIDPVFEVFVRSLDGQGSRVCFTDIQVRKPGVVGSLTNGAFDGILSFLPDVNEGQFIHFRGDHKLLTAVDRPKSRISWLY